MRKILCLAASLGLIMNVACGRTEEKTVEKAAEQQIERETGDLAAVDFSENGMEITSVDGDGVYSIQGGDSAEIPAEFPADVYVLDDASVILVSDSPNGFVVGLSTDTALATVVETYQKEMSAAGWNKMTETVMDGGRMTVYLKDERSVNVGIFEEDGAREISLSVSK
jgi:hypothetical protein